jgi:hypothetical protein
MKESKVCLTSEAIIWSCALLGSSPSVWHPDTVYRAAHVSWESTPGHINRQRYLGRCMCNGIRRTLTPQRFLCPLEVLGTIEIIDFGVPRRAEPTQKCHSGNVNQSAENVWDSSHRGASSMRLSSEYLPGLHGSSHLLLQKVVY